MKKKLFLATVGLSIALLSAGIGAYAATKMTLIVNGKTVAADIKLINNAPYLPLSALSGSLKGVTIKYDANTGIIKIDEPNTASAVKLTWNWNDEE